MNIIEVARLAGVSISTVSRVINKQKVGAESKAIVQDIVKRYNYQPDPYAQHLARRRNGNNHK